MSTPPPTSAKATADRLHAQTTQTTDGAPALSRFEEEDTDGRSN